QAAAYVAEQEAGFGFVDYLRLYESYEPELLGQRTAGATEYPDSVFLTWRATIDKLSPGARATLRLASFLAPTPIPAEMRLAAAALGVQAREMGLEPSVTVSEFSVRQWKSDLGRYSLLQTVGQDAFSVHALLQAVERHQVPVADQPGMILRAAALLMAWAPTP